MHSLSKSFIVSLGLHILFLVIFYVIYLFSQEKVINQKIVIELVSSVPKVKSDSSVKNTKKALQKQDIDSVLDMLKQDKTLKMPESKPHDNTPQSTPSSIVPLPTKEKMQSQKPKEQKQNPLESSKLLKNQVESKAINSNKNQDVVDKIKNIAPISQNSISASSKEEKNKELANEEQSKSLEQAKALQENNKKDNENNQDSISSLLLNEEQLNQETLQEEINPKEDIAQQSTIDNPLVQEKESPKIIEKQAKSLTINKNNDSFEDFLTTTEKTLAQKVENIEEISNLSESEKDLLRSKITKCWSGLISIREKDLILIVEIFMNSDATINNVQIKTEDKSVSKKEIESLQKKVKEIFSNPQCIALPLPKDRYETWKQFSIKLNLKGFFQ